LGANNYKDVTRNRGFTLVELMITLAIIAIISTFAIPAYTNHIQKSRRVDAQGALMQFANTMERYYAQNNTYVGAAVGSSGIFPAQVPLDGSKKYYDLSISGATATAYTLIATPREGQAGNGRLTVDATGTRVWNTKDDGSGENHSW
jgi:type IV pilus assembly protein PilE